MNSIPASERDIDIRILPGSNSGEMLARVTEAVGENPGAEVRCPESRRRRVRPTRAVSHYRRAMTATSQDRPCADLVGDSHSRFFARAESRLRHCAVP